MFKTETKHYAIVGCGCVAILVCAALMSAIESNAWNVHRILTVPFHELVHPAAREQVAQHKPPVAVSAMASLQKPENTADEPIRVAGEPLVGSVKSPSVSDETATERARLELQAPDAELGDVPSAEDDAPISTNESAAEPKRNEIIDRADELYKEHLKEQLDKLIQVGGDLVDEGVDLPSLRVKYELADIEALVRDGYGMVVANYAGNSYQIIPEGSSFLSAKRFEPLSERAKSRHSNRGFNLSEDRQIKDSFLTLIMGLNNYLDKPTVGRDVSFVFHPVSQLDHYIAAKQLGCMEGIDFRSEAVSTIGRLTSLPRGPLFTISSYQVGGKYYDWEDPELKLLAIAKSKD